MPAPLTTTLAGGLPAGRHADHDRGSPSDSRDFGVAVNGRRRPAQAFVPPVRDARVVAVAWLFAVFDSGSLRRSRVCQNAGLVRLTTSVIITV